MKRLVRENRRRLLSFLEFPPVFLFVYFFVLFEVQQLFLFLLSEVG